MKASEFRPGMAANMDGQVWIVTSYEHVKPGKGPAYAQLKLKNAITGANIEKRFRSTEELEQAIVDRREMEFLYADSEGGVFMDNETFDQITIPYDVLGNAMDFLKPNTVVTAQVYQGNVIAIDLPSTVELEVTDTPPELKGATVTNQLKEATCETGLKTKVPPFITVGEKVKISTETGEYVGRGSGD
jgi:elongation factor P